MSCGHVRRDKNESTTSPMSSVSRKREWRTVGKVITYISSLVRSQERNSFPKILFPFPRLHRNHMFEDESEREKESNRLSAHFLTFLSLFPIPFLKEKRIERK
jgi:hypothetical protein